MLGGAVACQSGLTVGTGDRPMAGLQDSVFAGRALASGLLTAEQLQQSWRALRQELGTACDDRQFARYLVKQGLLTRYQAELLMAGRTEGFFLEKYKILDEIGSGGMGRVFKAQHTELGRLVALKVLPRVRASREGAVERFMREARASAQLDHPNIVRTYDVGEDHDVHFITMEYVEGATVFQTVKEHGLMDARAALEITAQVTRGLSHAWQRGIIHRDIKPGNVLLAKDGTAKVLDMGLAQYFDEETAGTTAERGRRAIGTGDYMSPEQARGVAEVDFRADIYCLGCTLYFMLARRPPFHGRTTREKLRKHRIVRPRPVQRYNPKVPDRVAAIVRRMMSKRPRERYNSAEELLADLAGRGPVRVPEDERIAQAMALKRRLTHYVLVPWYWHLRWIVPSLASLIFLVGIAVIVILHLTA